MFDMIFTHKIKLKKKNLSEKKTLSKSMVLKFKSHKNEKLKRGSGTSINPISHTFNKES